MAEYLVMFEVVTEADDEEDAVGTARLLIAEPRYEPAIVELLGDGVLG